MLAGDFLKNLLTLPHRPQMFLGCRKNSMNIFILSFSSESRRGCDKNHDFRPISPYISKTIQGMAIVAMEGEDEFLCSPLHGGISCDLEWP